MNSLGFEKVPFEEGSRIEFQIHDSNAIRMKKVKGYSEYAEFDAAKAIASTFSKPADRKEANRLIENDQGHFNESLKRGDLKTAAIFVERIRDPDHQDEAYDQLANAYAQKSDMVQVETMIGNIKDEESKKLALDSCQKFFKQRLNP